MADFTIDSRWYQRPPGVRERIAAGGIVVRSDAGRVFVVLTREKSKRDYILPKGGIEKGESLEQAARREIAEEAGITQLELLESLGTRSRLSFNKNRWTTTQYFLFQSGQIEPGVTEKASYVPGWFPIDALPNMLWPEQRELIEVNRDKITQLLKNK